MTEKTLHIPDHDEVRALFGARDQFLNQIRDRVGIDVIHRGDDLRLRGDEANVDEGLRVLGELRRIVGRGAQLTDRDVAFVLAGEVVESSARDGHSPHVETPSNGRNGSSESEPDEESLGPSSIDIFEKAKTVKPRTPGQGRYIDAIRGHDLVFCKGPAGCGKTYLAVAMAVNALRTERVRKIVLVRPAVEAGERLGFLPGDIFAKVNPYLRPLLDALHDILDFEQVRTYMEKDVIEIVPLAFMRGRTLGNTFMILDEAQNTTVTQMKMFLTRMGTGSKIVVTGDVTQVDLPDHVPSGLTDGIRRLAGVQGVGTVELDARDIVRHRLVREIVAAYDQDERKRRK